MPAWLTSLLTAFAGQTFGYFVVVSALFFVVWRWGAARLAHRRIATRGRPFDRSQLLFELRHTAAVLAIGAAQAAALLSLQERGWLMTGAASFADAPIATVVTFFVIILVNDLWFYAVHRALHTRWLFKHVHAVHHRSVDVNPFSSYSFHVVEAALLTGWLIPVAMIVPLPMPALMAAQAAGLANNVMAHLGYELLPAWWIRAPGLRWSNSATFHSLHHARFNGNFGLFTRAWDRLFGTELEGYEAAFAAATASPSPGEPARVDP